MIDERFDYVLLGEVARRRPDWQFVMIGPIVKIDPALLPHGENVHYVGMKSYKELPAYLSNWNVAILPLTVAPGASLPAALISDTGEVPAGEKSGRKVSIVSGENAPLAMP